MAGAMEAITTNALLLIQLDGQRIAVGVFGQALVKGGIERGHLGQVGKQGLGGVDAQQVGRVMQGRQRAGGTDRCQGVLIQ